MLGKTSYKSWISKRAYDKSESCLSTVGQKWGSYKNWGRKECNLMV